MNREGILRQRFADLVNRWLDDLPGDSWQGTPSALAAGLNRLANYADPTPRNPSGPLKGILPFIEARGWRMTEGRTNAARFIRFERG